MLDLIPGTGSSNPLPSSGESTNFRFLSGGARIVEKLSPIVTGYVVGWCEKEIRTAGGRRLRGALNPLPLSRKSSGVSGKPSGSLIGTAERSPTKNQRLVGENLQIYFRMIGSPRNGKEQRAWHVDEPSPVADTPRPRQHPGASRADFCFVVSPWPRITSQRRPSLGASPARPRYLLFERNSPPAGWQDRESNGVYCCSSTRRNIGVGRYRLRRQR